MTQRNLFSYFAPKSNQSTPQSSPVQKKQTALRALTKIAKKNEDSDFELSSNSESSSDDEQEFKRLVSEEKLKKANGGKSSSSYSEESDSYGADDSYSDEEEKSPKKTKKVQKKLPASPKSPRSRKSPKKVLSSKSSMEFDAPIGYDHDKFAKEAAASVSEEDLPDWLSSNLRDANKRRPTDEGYDPTTVYIPKSEEDKFTPFQKQFWAIKRNNFNSIVMIRKGKFYEMFSVDAIFARDFLKLHLTWRGKEPMCGVPEKAFSEWAVKIVHAGKSVCKVEQMETAIDQRNRKGGEKAITRELVQIYSPGTIDDFEMLESSQPSYLLSIKSSDRQKAGVCLVDCSTGTFHLGDVSEEDLADTLIKFEPVEVIYNAGSIVPEHLELIKHYCGQIASKSKSAQENWDGHLALNAIQRIAKWDDVPEELQKFPPDAIAALGGCVAYLDEHKIAKNILALQKFKPLEEAGSQQFMNLDSSALTNLNIISKEDRSLLNILDHCFTPFGKRRLRYWVMHPLMNKQLIDQRLDAVEEMMSQPLQAAVKKIKSLPDLERMLARVYSNRSGVKVFIDTLQALQSAANFLSEFENKVQSPLLKHLAPEGKGAKLAKKTSKILNELEIDKSLEKNEFILKKGVFEDIDNIDNEVLEVENKLNDVLKSIRKEVGCKDINYVHIQSVRYQIAIPVRYTQDLDDRFTLQSNTKTVYRYYTPEVKELIRELEDVENERQKLRSGSQKRFIDDFSKYSGQWDGLVDAIADIDCITSLAETSLRWKAGGICRPTIVDINSEEAHGQAMLKLKQMRHPCLATNNIIPNDADIHDKFVLLITGPNASGKSTYARMCCLAIVLAQIGCFLPAKSANLTVFSQIFTRIGASDRMFNGQSTYAVETAETGRLMRHAKKDTFVVLDELGRGTSTIDGIATAAAVLEYFINTVKCPLVFCTHYHVLAEQYDNFSEVRNASMRYEIKDELVLAYTLIDGMCPSSFGCKVAELCGLPKSLTEEAQKVADDFEERHPSLRTTGSGTEIKEIPVNPQIKDLKEKIDKIYQECGGNDVQFYARFLMEAKTLLDELQP